VTPRHSSIAAVVQHANQLNVFLVVSGLFNGWEGGSFQGPISDRAGAATPHAIAACHCPAAAGRLVKRTSLPVYSCMSCTSRGGSQGRGVISSYSCCIGSCVCGSEGPQLHC
jgi:hypothetical protein